jgi:hypothetical protein
MGWFLDFFRLAWGLLYWNTRKSIYRLRQPRGRCPCQHPSDSGRAHETACAAVANWTNPERFRRLCPLLERTQAGPWRCSVNDVDVRPFWGRALAYYGCTTAGLYLFAGLAVFLLLHTIGYRVTYAGVVWPPAWSRFVSIRSQFFLEQYRTASASGDRQKALMSLSTAYGLDPANYEAGRQLAQLWQVSQPTFSDNLYARLLHEHPVQAEATAQVWFRALLARGDFVQIEKLAAARITAAPAAPGAWINAFLFANRRTRDAEARGRLIALPELSATARFLITLASDLNTLPSAAIHDRLLQASAEATDAASFYQVCRELVSRGFAQSALTVLERRNGLLGARDQVALRLDALAVIGWKPTLLNVVDSLLIADPTAPVVDLLCAHLIRHPDAEVAARLFNRLQATPLPAAFPSYPSYLALVCAAATGKSVDQLEWAMSRLQLILKGGFARLDKISHQWLIEPAHPRVEDYLPALQPLSLDVMFALLDQSSTAPR